MGCEDSLQFELFVYSLRSRPGRDYTLKTFSPIFYGSPRLEYLSDHEDGSIVLKRPYFAETTLDRIFRFSPDFKASDALRLKKFFTAMIVKRLISLIFRT